MPTGKRNLVLGLGNHLMCDDGAGIHVVRRLRDTHRGGDDLLFMDGGTLSFTLAPYFADAENLLVIDAAQLGEAPGTVRLFLDEQMDRFLNAGGKRSVHEVSLADLLSIARLTDSLPARRALIGIQPQCVEWGESPWPAVAAAIPNACDLAWDLLSGWGAFRPTPSDQPSGNAGVWP